MMYINSFLTELSKKIDTVDLQLKDFENKMNRINSIKNMLILKTLKDIDSIMGEDLVLLSGDDFAQILEVFRFDDPENKLKMFFNSSVTIKVYQKLISEGEIEVKNKDEVEQSKKWLEEQLKYIKEYISDFNNNNKEYYNSLKISDLLYKKYIGFFKNNKLVKTILNINEFNEVIKKSGIITSEKWQLLKYVGEKNIEFLRKNESTKKENIEYSDDEIISFVETILKKEKELIDTIDDDKLKIALEMIDYEDEKINSMNFSESDIVRYQKIPILDTMSKIYNETILVLKKDSDEDAIKIEKNLKDLLELIDSYNVIKKLES